MPAKPNHPEHSAGMARSYPRHSLIDQSTKGGK
jgi:hypothetical protein